MTQVWIPVLLSAFVVPGAGQLYNGERAKGYVFIGITILLMAGFFIGTATAVAGMVQPGVPLSPEETRVLAERVMDEKSGFIQSFVVLFLAVWGYGLVDAWLGARARAAKAPAGGSPNSE